MKIASIPLAPGAALAPMAGFTDAACRDMAVRHGAAYTVSEMVSAKALTFGDKKSAQLIRCKPNGAPYGVQLFGAEPETMGQAARLIQHYDYDFIDINMGCPAPKITSSGAGSRLLLDPALCGRIVAAVVEASDGRPVTVKMRAGWDGDHITAVETAKACEAAGAALIAVHGRTRKQMYIPGTVDWSVIAAVKAAVSVPVLGNGDITTADEARAMMEATGCDGVMVGRGALGNPWLFGEIAAMLKGEPAPPPPTLRQRMEELRRQVYEMCENKGEWVAMPQARSQAIHYMKGLRGAAALRAECSRLEHFSDIDRLIEKVWQENS